MSLIQLLYDVWSQEYNKKSSWIRRAETFSVEITLTVEYKDLVWSSNSWEVWITLKEEHPLFSLLAESQNAQEHQRYLDQIPCHGGICWDSLELRDGPPYIRLGSYYRHEGDERFGSIDFVSTAWEIRADADKQFIYLLNFSAVLAKRKTDDNAH